LPFYQHCGQVLPTISPEFGATMVRVMHRGIEACRTCRCTPLPRDCRGLIFAILAGKLQPQMHESEPR
jgi:hypothetical protein